jgi:hypothetical protein
MNTARLTVAIVALITINTSLSAKSPAGGASYAPDFSGYRSHAVAGARRYGDVRPTRGYATAFGYHGPAYYSTHRRPRAR